MKTGYVALVLCLNIGVDPPDVIKITPCARMECWIGTTLLSYLISILIIWCTIYWASTCFSMIGREEVGKIYNLWCDQCLKCSKSGNVWNIALMYKFLFAVLVTLHSIVTTPALSYCWWYTCISPYFLNFMYGILLV